MNRQPPESIWTTSVNVYELRFGIELLQDGGRRKQLEIGVAELLEQDLGSRVLSFDGPAAHSAAQIAAQQRRAGRSVEIRDVQIAGIAAARRAILATRNTRHFSGIGLALVDPWIA